MGVQSGTNQNEQHSSFAGAASHAAAGMSAQTNASEHAAAPESNMWSFDGAGLADLVSVKAGGADVRTIQSTINGIMVKEQPQGDFAIDTLLIDNTVEVGWRFSAVVLTLKQKNTNTVAFFPLILESTASAPLEPDHREVGAIVYVVDHVPSDALDASFLERILKVVADAHPGAELVDCGGMVVPKNIDASIEDQVRPVLHNAARACMTAIVEQNPDFIDMNLGLRQDNTYQTVSMQVVNQHAVDIVEQPIRQDVVITLTSRQKQNNDGNRERVRSVHNIGATEKVIGGIGGFFDVVFAPKAANAGYGMYNQNPLDRTRQFIPRFTITAMNQPRLATLASTLLLIEQATVLSEQSVRDSVFFQRMKQARLNAAPKDKSVDVTDVGVLNLASNIKNEATPTVYDLRSNAHGPDDFAAFMDQVFMPGFGLSIDVPRAGPQSWVLDVFTGAASGDPAAMAEIVRAADKLTNGVFSQIFFAGMQAPVAKVEMFFSETNNTIHNGYFMKQEGDNTVKRDIREVDYLYVLNRFGTMDKTALDWAMTFLVNQMNPYQRMARRKEIIEACVGGRVYITGYSERHTFSDHFVKSLFASRVKLALKPTFQYNNPLAGANTGVVAPQFASGGLINGSLLQTGFSTGGNNASAGGVFLNPTQGRY